MAATCNQKIEKNGITILLITTYWHGLAAVAILVTLIACSSEPVKKPQSTMAGGFVTDNNTSNNKDDSPSDASQSNATPSIPMDLNEPDFSEYAYSYLAQNRSHYGLKDPYSQLSLVRENVDNQRKKHVTFQQVYKGVPVWGQEITVNLDHANRVLNVDGEKLKKIMIDSVKPAISKEKAAELVMQDNKWSDKGWKVEHSKLYIVNRNNHYELAYRLTLGDGFPRGHVFINAQDGKIIHINN